MSLSLGSDESYSLLVAALRDLLGPDCTISHPKDDRPLTLETSQDSVGFVILPVKDAARVFESRYEAYKRLYAEKHEEWQTKNLSFVVCHQPVAGETEALLSSVEMDPYFCRKYVVQFEEGIDRLCSELRRLPFLPIDDERNLDVARPTSAYVLLQSYGISSTLAEYITAPRLRSAERIVKDTLQGSLALPELSRARKTTSLRDARTLGQSRLKRIKVQGFRAYREPKVFDMDTDIVVLYGPNGLGKTSFFDAIDYVCTGRIGRLYRRMNDSELRKATKHLDVEDVSCVVDLEATINDRQYTISRNLDDGTHAWVNGEHMDRSRVLQLLTSAEWGDRRERIEVLERLFRATHLFSQSTPELLSDFDKECGLSASLVSQTLALEDYAAGTSKLDEVLDILRTQIADLRKQRPDIVTKLEMNKQLRDNYEPTGGTEHAGTNIRRLAEDLLLRIHNATGRMLNLPSLDPECAKDLRSLIQADLDSLRARIRGFQSLESQLPRFSSLDTTLKTKKAALADISNTQLDLDERVSRLEETIDSLNSQIARSLADVSEASTRIENLARLEDMQETYASSCSAIDSLRAQRANIEATSKSAVGQMEQANKKLGEAELAIRDRQRALGSSQQRTGLLKRILAALPRRSSALKSRIDLSSSLQVIPVDIDKKAQELNDLELRASSLRRTLDKAEHDLSLAQKYRDDLDSLLGQLEPYIRDGVCPVCGTDHHTTESLVHKMRRARDSVSPQTAQMLDNCRHLRALIEDLDNQSTHLRGEIAALRDRWTSAQKTLAGLEELVKEFEQLASQVGLGDRVDSLDAKTIEGILEEESHLQGRLLDEIGALQKGRDDTRAVLAALKDKETAEKRNIERIAAEINNHLSVVDRLRDEVASLGLDMDMRASEKALATESLRSAMRDANSRATELVVKRDKLARDLAEAEERITQNMERGAALEDEISSLERDLEGVRAQLTSLGLPSGIALQELTEERTKANAKASALQTLVDDAITLEKAIEASSMSAELARLQNEISALEVELRELNSVLSRTETIEKWFMQVRDILATENADAIKRHITAYGPLAACLQQRLRSVFGFRGIRLDPLGDKIRILTDWKETTVRPVDYFSDSQKQILMLSLFLSGRLTQTWSRFPAILLDDPVTHFDDLNAFGFVELLRGILMSSQEKCQFFVSTCEERLFELLRRKFRSDKARFYKFAGITSEGPIVKSVE